MSINLLFFCGRRRRISLIFSRNEQPETQNQTNFKISPPPIAKQVLDFGMQKITWQEMGFGKHPPMFQQNSHIFPFFLKECVPYGCRNRPAQHPSHSSIVSWLTMTKFSVSTLLLLFCFKICTAMIIHRNPIVGRLIQTKSGNLFLQHSNKAKKGNQFIQESLQAASSSIVGHDYSGKNMQHTTEKQITLS